MLKKITCICGEEMTLKNLDVRNDITTYWVEAEYSDGSHTCTLIGEFSEDDVISLLDCKQTGGKHGKD